MMKMIPAAVSSVALLLLVACEPAAPPSTEGLEFGTALSAERQKLYERSCYACHRNDVPGLPRAGDPDDWKERRTVGLDGLVERAMKGFRGMPPMGMCPTCTQEDMRALVAYMAGIELPTEEP